MTATPRRSPAGALALGSSATIVCLLPVFLTGAMAFQLTESLGFGTVGLGAAVALNRAAGAATAPFLGGFADRLGATRSIRIAATAAAVAALGIALTATTWLTYVAWLLLSGAAHALVVPAANRMLSTVVPPGRLGAAFGVKQSAPPTTTMLAGLSVPVLALTLGWRSAFYATAVLAVIVAITAREVTPRTARPAASGAPPAPLEARRALLYLAVSLGLAAAASSATTTFYVDAAVPAGTTPQTAGTLLAVASLAAILTRLGTGVLSDHMTGGHLNMSAGFVAGGCVGLALLGSDDPTLMAVGVVVSLVGVWGFNGVVWYALMRRYPQSPGRVTGTIAPGILLGGTIGPLVLGVVADGAGYPTMWWLTAAIAVVAVAGIVASARGLPTPADLTGEGRR